MLISTNLIQTDIYFLITIKWTGAVIRVKISPKLTKSKKYRYINSSCQTSSMAIYQSDPQNLFNKIMNCRLCSPTMLHPNCTQCGSLETMIQQRELCTNCTEPRLPPYLSYIGQNYEHTPLKILFVGQIVHVSRDDRKMWQTYNVTFPFETYSFYLEYYRNEFAGHDEYEGDYIFNQPSYGIENIIRLINSTCSPPEAINLDNIAFTNISKCANLNGRKAEKEWKPLMKTCWNNFFIEELKLLKPDIIIPFWGKFFDYFDKESEIQLNERDETVFNLPPLNNSDWNHRTLRIWNFGNDDVKRFCIKFYHPSSERTPGNYGRNKPSFTRRIDLITRFIQNYR